MNGTRKDKRCPKCTLDVPLSGWNKNKGRSDGLAVWCKTCMAAYNREWRARPEVRERQAQLSAERYAGMSEEERARYIQDGTARRRAKGYDLNRKYGITAIQYKAILDSQGGGCAICGKSGSDGRRMPVDHDHTCCPGELTCGACIRGILCITCNVWLGFYENQEWMDRAGTYLSTRAALMPKP